MFNPAPPPSYHVGDVCGSYDAVKLYDDTVVANSPDCRWQVVSFGRNDPAKSVLVRLEPKDIASGDNAFVIDRATGRSIYHFSMYHNARVYWLRDGRTLIVNLGAGPGEDATALAIPLSSLDARSTDLSQKVLPDVFRRTGFPRANTHSYVSYVGTRTGRWRLSVSLETTRSGLPGKDSRCYLYSLKPKSSEKPQFIGSSKSCVD